MRPIIRTTYDKSVDAAYIYLEGSISKAGVARTIHVPTVGAIALDFAADGRLLGIEVLHASKLLPHLAKGAR